MKVHCKSPPPAGVTPNTTSDRTEVNSSFESPNSNRSTSSSSHTESPASRTGNVSSGSVLGAAPSSSASHLSATSPPQASSAPISNNHHLLHHHHHPHVSSSGHNLTSGMPTLTPHTGLTPHSTSLNPSLTGLSSGLTSGHPPPPHNLSEWYVCQSGMPTPPSSDHSPLGGFGHHIPGLHHHPATALAQY